MSGKAFGNMAESAINEASRGDVGASSPALRHSEPERRSEHMPFEHEYGDSIANFKIMNAGMCGARCAA